MGIGPFDARAVRRLVEDYRRVSKASLTFTTAPPPPYPLLC